MALEVVYKEYNFTENQGYLSELVTATGGYEPYTWEIINGTVLPDGMVFNGSTGLITGAALTVQSLMVDFRVTDTNPGGAETATASLPFVVVEAPSINPNEAWFEIYVGIPKTFTSAIVGGVGPYTLERTSWPIGPLPTVDDSAVVGSDIVWSFTVDVEEPCFASYRITDANGAIADTSINLVAIDSAVGNGGNGIPHIFFRDGNEAFAETESPCYLNITGIRGVYGGIPPYTLDVLTSLPPGTDVTWGIAGAPYYNGWITGTFSDQIDTTITHRVTDSASTVMVGSPIPAMYLWNDGTPHVSSTPDLLGQSMQEIVGVTHLGGDGHATVWDTYGFILGYASTEGSSVDLANHSFIGNFALPVGRILYNPLAFSDSGAIAACITEEYVDPDYFYYLETFSHSAGVLTHVNSVLLPERPSVYSIEAICFSSSGVAYVSGANSVFAVDAPYTSITSTIAVGSSVYTIFITNSDTQLLVYSSTGGGTIYLVDLADSNAVTSIDISSHAFDYPSMTRDRQTMLLNAGVSGGGGAQETYKIEAPFSAASAITLVGEYHLAGDNYRGGYSLPDNTGMIFRNVFSSGNTILNMPAGTTSSVLDSPNQGVIITGRGPALTPYGPSGFSNNVAEFDINLELFKKIHISPIQLNVGIINSPYRYQIKDNYMPGDVSYPTYYVNELNGQGLLPTGYTTYHDPDTNENFIQGTTEFSNAFPITLGAYNARYSGGAPRSTWDTTLYVGGVVNVTHEVI